MKRQQRSQKLNKAGGFAIIEVMVAAVVVGIVAVGAANVMTVIARTQRQANTSYNATQIYRTMIQIINSDAPWQKTILANPGVGLDCLAPDQTCTASTVNMTTNPLGPASMCSISAGGMTCGGVSLARITTLRDGDDHAFYTWSPSSGYTAQGAPCNSFNGGLNTGNDQCPLHYDVFWWPSCPSGTATCQNATPHIAIRPTYNPAKQNLLPFDPNNYGTWNFVRGSDPFSCNWTMDVVTGFMTETCATVGIGTYAYSADAQGTLPKAELLIAQGTDGVAGTTMAQNWFLDNTRSLNFDAGRSNYTALTSGNGLRLTADPAQHFYELYLAKSGNTVIGGVGAPGQPTIPPYATVDVRGDLLLRGLKANTYVSQPGGYLDYNRLGHNETNLVNSNPGGPANGFAWEDSLTPGVVRMIVKPAASAAYGRVGLGTFLPDNAMAVDPVGQTLTTMPSARYPGIHSWDLVADDAIVVSFNGAVVSYISQTAALFTSQDPSTAAPLRVDGISTIRGNLYAKRPLYVGQMINVSGDPYPPGGIRFSGGQTLGTIPPNCASPSFLQWSGSDWMCTPMCLGAGCGMGTGGGFITGHGGGGGSGGPGGPGGGFMDSDGDGGSNDGNDGGGGYSGEGAGGADGGSPDGS